MHTYVSLPKQSTPPPSKISSFTGIQKKSIIVIIKPVSEVQNFHWLQLLITSKP